jgi:hypothetical protein
MSGPRLTFIAKLLLLGLLLAGSPAAQAQGSAAPIGLWQGLSSGDYIWVQANGACSASGSFNMSGSCTWSATSTGGVLTMTYQWTLGPATVAWSVQWLNRDVILVNQIEQFVRRG